MQGAFVGCILCLLPLASFLICALLVDLCCLLWGTAGHGSSVVDLEKTFGKIFSFFFVGVVCCIAMRVLENQYFIFYSFCHFVYVLKGMNHFVDAG